MKGPMPRQIDPKPQAGGQMGESTSPSQVAGVDKIRDLLFGNDTSPNSEVAGVDKIRDLLFGNQMEDYDRRFSILEERFFQRFREIESETARNLSSLESYAKKQIESLAAQLREEKDLRSDADTEIERNQREHNDTIEKRLRLTSDQLSRLDREQANRLSQEVQSLREGIKRRNEDFQHTIEKMLAGLSSVADRTSAPSQMSEAATVAEVSDQPQRSVDVDVVIRGGSYIVGATSMMSLIATVASGAVIIQPLVSVALLIGAIGFYCMTLVKS